MLRLRRLPRSQQLRAALAPPSAAAPRLPLAGRWPQQSPLQQQQHRLLWSRTSDLMSWMGLREKPAQAAEEAEKGDQVAKEVAAVEEEAAASKAEEEAAAAVQKAPSRTRRVVAAGALEVDVAAGAARDVKRAMLSLQRHVLAAKGDPVRLSELWAMARSFQSFVLQDGAARAWEPAATADDANAEKRPLALQLLPLGAFVDVARRVQALEIGTPACFVGRHVDAAPDAESVVFVSEKTLLRQLIRALASCKSETAHREGKQLFEQYEAERRAAIDSLLNSEANSSSSSSDAAAEAAPLSREQLEDWTRLSKDTYAAYIDLLVALEEHAQVVAFFERPGHIRQYLGSPQTLRKLMKACLAETRGDVARRAVDEFHAHFPWLVLGRNSYQMALQACFKSRERKKTPEQLQNTLHVYALMTTGAGYIVYPNIWSALFNACVYIERHDEAVALFGTYAAQHIAPFAHRFTQALRTACKLQQFDTAIAMVHKWMEVEAAKTAASASILDNQAAKQQHAKASKAEVECFNKVLWEMLKGEPTLAQLTSVLRAMQQRQAPAGAQVIRLLVPRFLTAQGGEADVPPQVRMQRLLALWDEVPSVIERNAFVVHLLIDQCLALGWESECEQLVAFAVANRIELPMGSLVKIMEAWEENGRVGKIAPFAQQLLRALDEPARARLSQSFFEVFLMNLLREQRFAEILQLNDELKLTTRFSKSQVLFMIVKDAGSV